MKAKEVKRRLVVCLLALSGLVPVGGTVYVRAQSMDSSEARRKIKSLGRPSYPDLARKLNLTGVVKVEVVIAPDGKVKRTRILGGHPVLTAEAERAAQQTEFEPGPKETTEIIEFKFTP